MIFLGPLYSPYEEEYFIGLGEHERQSVDLTVSENYKKIFNDLKVYMEKEIKELEDDTLNQEIKMLDEIIDA